MGVKLDLTGQEINNIKFISFSHIKKNKYRMWNCICHCGKSFQCYPPSVKIGNTTSCGCYAKNMTIKRNKANRKWQSNNKNMHAVWHAMISRCQNQNNWRYKYYGARGISVCESWQNFDNYYEWINKNLGERPSKKHSLDRINNDGNYEPGNLRWADPSEQAKNKRGPKLNKQIVDQIRSDATTMSRKELSEKYGVAESMISRIINNKRWSV